MARLPQHQKRAGEAVGYAKYAPHCNSVEKKAMRHRNAASRPKGNTANRATHTVISLFPCKNSRKRLDLFLCSTPLSPHYPTAHWLTLNVNLCAIEKVRVALGLRDPAGTKKMVIVKINKRHISLLVCSSAREAEGHSTNAVATMDRYECKERANRERKEFLYLRKSIA